MSFLTSRIYSTLSPPRQRESTTSFLPIALGRWELSIFFCCILCGKSCFSTIGQRNFVGRFQNFVGRFPNSVGRFSNFVGHFSNFIGRFQNFVGDFPNFVGRFPNSVGRFSNFVGHFSNFIGRFQNFVGDFPNFVGDFSVYLVSMRKMCTTITTIHGLSVQPFAYDRE